MTGRGAQQRGLRPVEAGARDRQFRRQDHLPHGDVLNRFHQRRKQPHPGQGEDGQRLQPHAEHERPPLTQERVGDPAAEQRRGMHQSGEQSVEAYRLGVRPAVSVVAGRSRHDEHEVPDQARVAANVPHRHVRQAVDLAWVVEESVREAQMPSARTTKRWNACIAPSLLPLSGLWTMRPRS